MDVREGKLDAGGLRIAIAVSRWNELITKELLAGALDELQRRGGTPGPVVRVPGTWELPLAIRDLMDESPRPDAVVALGCILQGQTNHAGLLAGDVSSALMAMMLETRIPVAYGILTPETAEQGLDRAGLKHGNKGREAMAAAIEMATLRGAS